MPKTGSTPRKRTLSARGKIVAKLRLQAKALKKDLRQIERDLRSFGVKARKASRKRKADSDLEAFSKRIKSNFQ